MNKKTVLAMLALQMVLAGAVGCGSNDNYTQEAVSATTEANSEQPQTSGFDFERAVNNIMLDGEKINLPTTLNELGEEYTIDDIWDMEDGYDTAVLLKNEEEVAAITYVHNDNLDVREKTICEIGFPRIGIEYGFISIDGINAGDSIAFVKKSYGEPTEFRMDKTSPKLMGDGYLYKNNENDSIRFRVNEKGEIISMSISFLSSVK